MPVSFSGGSALPAPGTAAYSVAQQGSGSASYNPSSNSLTFNNGNSIYNAPKNTDPAIPETVNGADLGTASQYNVPPAAQTGSSHAFVASLPGSQVQTDPSNDSTGDGNTGNAITGGSAEDNIRRMILGQSADTAGAIGQEGAAYQSAAEGAQIPEQMQALASIRGTIAQRTAAYTAQWQLANTEHAALPYIAGEQTQIQRTQAVELGMLTAQEQALSGNLQASEDYVNQSISHQFDGLKNQLSAYGQLYQEVGNDLTSSEQLKVQQNYNIQNINYQNLISTGKDISNTLATQGLLTPAIATQLSQAKSISDFWGIYSTAINGGSYQGGSGTGSQNTDPIINGVDYSSYATSSNTIANTRATANLIGQITSVNGADNAISSLHDGSPITGAMVVEAASKYGVDPTLLISTMNAETQLGTDKSAGSKGNNFGNVGNTDSAMAAGKPVNYASPQAGVNAVAAWISQHKVSAGQVASNQTASTTQGGQNFDTLQASAPPGIGAPGVLNQVRSTGSAYIDTSLVSKDVSPTFLSNWAKSHNVALLTHDDAETVKSLDEAISNVTNVVGPSWAQVAYEGRLGYIGGLIAEPFNQASDSDTFSNNKAFADNKENLAQQIKALSGSSPKLGLLSTALEALPQTDYLRGWNGSFMGGDTYKDGVNKLNKTLQLLNQGVASFIPGDKGTSLLPLSKGGGSPSANTNNIVTAPDGRSIQITD